MIDPMNFRQLVDTALAEGVPAHRRPRLMSWLVRKTGVSRAQLYNYISGKQTAPPWKVVKIARGLKLPAREVESALATSRDECEVAS